MARFVLKSRDHGDQSFFVPDNGGYVRLEDPQYGRDGQLGQQICDGGFIFGSTLSANAQTLERVARKWWKQRLAANRKS